MLRGGPLSSAPETPSQQRQKKRLSFREPEVETPGLPLYSGGCRPKAAGNSTGSRLRKGSYSVENLSLEDHALHIAQSVGSAFSELSLQEPSQENFLDLGNSEADIEDRQAEALINDCYLTNPSVYHTSSIDQVYLTDYSTNSPNMRGPTIETTEGGEYRSSLPSVEAPEEKYPSSAYHQIQLLRYQLDQQNQQTQLALHQVQLLSDQMEAESAARRKAQEQNNQLMCQNQDLLSHIERLFHQIEDMEKHIQILENEKRSRTSLVQELQGTQLRAPPFARNRRLSGDAGPPPNRGGILSTPRRSSLTSPKPQPPQKSPVIQSPRKGPLVPPPSSSPSIGSKPYNQAKQPQDAKKKETLHIGDASPPVQTGTLSPFGSGWKIRQEVSSDSTPDTASPAAPRTRTGSLSSFSKLKPPETATSTAASQSKGGSFGGGLSGMSPGATSKRFSSSTSDLYSAKPLVIEDGGQASGSKGAISGLSLSAGSKLPRFQPYVGRRGSVTKDGDQLSVLGKDKFKSGAQSLFNR